MLEEAAEGILARSTIGFSNTIPCLEILAKRVVYADLDPTPNEAQKEWVRWRLRDRGEGIVSLRLTQQDPATGFEMAVYQAIGFWVVCFCGSNDLTDWMNNLTEINIGRTAYRRNQDGIQDAISLCQQTGDRVFLVGHSLGGAIAQHAFLDSQLEPSTQLLTFNSPAIGWKRRDLPQFPTPIRHYQHAGDPVLRLSLIRLSSHKPQCGLLPGQIKTIRSDKNEDLSDRIGREARAWNHRRLLTLPST